MDNSKRGRSQAERIEAIQKQIQDVENVLDLFKHPGWVILVRDVEVDVQSLESTLHNLTTSSLAREQAAVALSIYRKVSQMPSYFEAELKGLQTRLSEATSKPDRSWMERILTFVR